MVNSVFTLYELSNGDDTEGEGTVSFKKKFVKIDEQRHSFQADGLTLKVSLCKIQISGYWL